VAVEDLLEEGGAGAREAGEDGGFAGRELFCFGGPALEVGGC
jgi:hypothetical protein